MYFTLMAILLPVDLTAVLKSSKSGFFIFSIKKLEKPKPSFGIPRKFLLSWPSLFSSSTKVMPYRAGFRSKLMIIVPPLGPFFSNINFLNGCWRLYDSLSLKTFSMMFPFSERIPLTSRCRFCP